jgi:hypothetical protein
MNNKAKSKLKAKNNKIMKSLEEESKDEEEE